MQIGPIRKLGERVRVRREALGLSQTAFAERADLDRLYYSRLERGLQNPSLLVLLRIALELGVELSELLLGLEVDAQELRSVERRPRGPGSRPAG